MQPFLDERIKNSLNVEEREARGLRLTVVSDGRDRCVQYTAQLKRANFSYSGEPRKVWTYLSINDDDVTLIGLLQTGAIEAKPDFGNATLHSGMVHIANLSHLLKLWNFKFDKARKCWTGQTDEELRAYMRTNAAKRRHASGPSDTHGKPDASTPMPDVNIVTSTDGGATLEAVASCAPSDSAALKKNGFSWCREDGVNLRLSLRGYTTTHNLVVVNALRASFDDGWCSLHPRCRLDDFSAVHAAAKRDGFNWDRERRAWRKEMNECEWLRFRPPKQAEEDEALQKWIRARERRFELASSEWEKDVRQDPTYDARSYRYSNTLVDMQTRGDMPLGSDGGVNWPAPPIPQPPDASSLIHDPN